VNGVLQPGCGGGVSPFAGAVDRPIFIGASPRSGTTLLRTMLNTHPEIAIPRETRFLPYVWEQRKRFGDLSEAANRRRLGKVIFTAPWTRADRLDTPTETALAQIELAPPTLGSVVGTCLELYAGAHDKKRWGDKRPMYARYLDAIFSMFPDAQFINVVRDPRAAVTSMRKLGWFDKRLAPGLDLWERSLRAVDPWRSRLCADQYADVRYEDLVTRPEEALGAVAEFLQISADDVAIMLRYYEDVDETARKYHARLSQPPTTDRIRSWEESIEPGEIAFIERIASRHMERFGYESTQRGPVPRHLLAEYHAHRRSIARKRRRVELRELKRLVDYHYPVAAQLTTSQRAGIRGARQPWFPARHVGKPR
jgi:hypothetical protein